MLGIPSTVEIFTNWNYLLPIWLGTLFHNVSPGWPRRKQSVTLRGSVILTYFSCGLQAWGPFLLEKQHLGLVSGPGPLSCRAPQPQVPPEELCLTQEWVLRREIMKRSGATKLFPPFLPNSLPSSLLLETVLTDSVQHLTHSCLKN